MASRARCKRSCSVKTADIAAIAFAAVAPRAMVQDLLFSPDLMERLAPAPLAALGLIHPLRPVR